MYSFLAETRKYSFHPRLSVILTVIKKRMNLCPIDNILGMLTSLSHSNAKVNTRGQAPKSSIATHWLHLAGHMI
jgi:hypothetical protein